MAPIFVIVDDDRAAVGALIQMLPSEWYYIHVDNPLQAVKYSREFATTAVLLADPLDYPRGGARRLLQNLLDDVGKPVVVLSESWTPESAEAWRRMGAAACVPHPTRPRVRVGLLRDTLQGLALSSPRDDERTTYFKSTGQPPGRGESAG